MPSAADKRAALGELLLGESLILLHKLGQLGHEYEEPIAVAVSGGPDSVALLLLLGATSLADRTFAVTVDHGLRPEAAREASDVAALCRQLGIAHTTLSLTVKPGSGGLQATARRARYAALADWCPAPCLAVAHHRDDVAESLLMRLRRGAGIGGLARMPAATLLRAKGPLLLRPLLDWSKADLLEVCARAGVRTIRDPSNDDPRFDRTAARITLARSPWLRPERLALAAANLADAEAALAWLAQSCWTSQVRQVEGDLVLSVDFLPHEIKRRLVQRAVNTLSPSDSPRNVERVVRRLDAGQDAMIADVQAIPGASWRFRRAPPRRGS